MADELNPYAAPNELFADEIERLELLENDPAVQLRRELLTKETFIRAIGRMYSVFSTLAFLVGTLCFVALIVEFVRQYRIFGEIILGGKMPIVAGLIISCFYGGLAAQGARWIALLDSRARIAVTIVSGSFLIIPPITLLNVVFLYLIFSKSGRQLFSDEYRGAVARTPNTRLNTGRPFLIYFGIIVGGFVLSAILLFSRI